MFENILLKLNPYMLYIKMIAIAAVFLSGCFVTRLYYTDKILKAELHTKEVEAKLADALVNVRVEYITKTNTIYVKGKDREIKIPVYIPAPDTNNKCDGATTRVNEGFVEFHNAAAENRQLAAMTQEQIDVVSPIVTMQTVASVINSNYTMCNKYITQIESLQDAVREIEKAYK